MSGKFIFSGLMTNKGENVPESYIKEKINSKIESLSIIALPLIQNKCGNCLVKYAFKPLQVLLCPSCLFSVIPSHLAVKLKLANDFIVIIEFGLYLTKESILKQNKIQVLQVCCKIKNIEQRIFPCSIIILKKMEPVLQ